MLLDLAGQIGPVDIPRDQPLRVAGKAAMGGVMRTWLRSLDWHQTQADLNGPIYLVHRLR
jgi:hypothetical protein